MKYFFVICWCLVIVAFSEKKLLVREAQIAKRKPNFIFAIADDQSYPHASVYQSSVYKTPVFDSVANNGLLFLNAFAAAPQCSPCRAAILTGRNIWQLEEAGTHSSLFPSKYSVFTQSLEENGYFVGFTGKPWAPGNFEASGWKQNPVGREFNKRKQGHVPAGGISNNDYAGNFEDFMAQKPAEKPFFFWFGSFEPHRNYEEGSGALSGLKQDDLEVPAFLPDHAIVKNDILDYALEINWFDKQLGEIINVLRESGELENTYVVVTSDNGMPFPSAKANLSEFGLHVPLALSGPGMIRPGRSVVDLVSLIDLAPTILDLAGISHFPGITGLSMTDLILNKKDSKMIAQRQYILAGRERHTHARPDNLGYPARAIRTKDFLYIHNYEPDRWPVGDPASMDDVDIVQNKDLKPIVYGYEDIDDSPTKKMLIQESDVFNFWANLSFAKRGEDELYAVDKDVACLNNLASHPAYRKKLEYMKLMLRSSLVKQGDPREIGNGDIFESYPRYGLMRPFPGFKERGTYNKAYGKK